MVDNLLTSPLPRCRKLLPYYICVDTAAQGSGEFKKKDKINCVYVKIKGSKLT